MPVAALEDGGWREWARIDAALAAGEIGERGWHDAVAEVIKRHDEDGVRLEPYGLDIIPELAELARRRLPHWADRIWVGNALHWMPPRRFDYVRVGLEYVPAHRRGDLVRQLMAHAVGRRLIIGPYTEEAGERAREEEIAGHGFRIEGKRDREHPDPRVMRRLFWICH